MQSQFAHLITVFKHTLSTHSNCVQADAEELQIVYSSATDSSIAEEARLAVMTTAVQGMM